MRISIARIVAEAHGIDHRPIRRAHRATWKWTNDGVTWNTGSWGASVRNTGFDVTCACGWESRTGGAIFARVAEDHDRHIADVIAAIVRDTEALIAAQPGRGAR